MDEVISMDGGNVTAEEAGIFALSVKQSVGEKFIAWASEHRSDPPIVLKFNYYVQARGDLSEALVVLLATSLVVAGAFFATADLRSGSPLAPKRDEVLEV